MYIAMGIAFSMIVVAPFIGRWRAQVWLRKHAPAERRIRTGISGIVQPSV